MPRKKKFENRVADAVRHFWQTRSRQDQRQGARSGRRDHGNRTAATGGKQLDGLIELICQLLSEAELPDDTIFRHGREDVTLPGFFRPTKQWDVLVVANDNLLASAECKALCGPSFGNNYNNRVEEAIGGAVDVWTAFREGAVDMSPRPFLGYILFLEDAAGSRRSVSVYERHFPVFSEFRDVSYAQRCEESLRRFVRERNYDSASLILSDREGGARGKFHEPAVELSFARFAALLCNHVSAAYKSITTNG